MKIIRIIFPTILCIMCSMSAKSQTAYIPQKFEMVRTYDPINMYTDVVMQQPSFYSIGGGKRVVIKLTNNGNKDMSSVSVFYIYHFKNGRVKRIGKERIPKLNKKQSYSFAINIPRKYSDFEKGDLTFTMRKNNVYRSFEFVNE